uniref:LITAF domain-containing protein n=3 Tax=Bombyx TaxID=7090 RepID=A0A8R2DKZ1_BOMMO|nr:lipopolysaccharide-induced tumor necrosis factor-alpha factor homolog isoform X1 [Bombyx mori]
MIMNSIKMVTVGPDPAQVTCPSCHASVMTKITTKASTKTHIIALILCLCMCLPCVCLPYCMDSCMNSDHYCPNCNAYIGTYTR